MRADEVAKGHGLNAVPKLVKDPLEEQIRKHYGDAPAASNDKVMSIMYACDVR